MTNATKLAGYTADEIVLAEQLEILIKACWRAYAAKGTIPAMIWTCIKFYLVEAPYLAPIYGALFSFSEQEFMTGLDVQHYVLAHVR